MSTCPETSVYWEIAHVQKVYDLIAPHYNDVKHRTWPKVNKFLKNLASGSLVADVGCGNGRYLYVNPMIYKFGSDICTSFLEQARVDGHEVLAADNIVLPYRDGVFDAVCSIGVIHHFSSRNRRIRAIKEMARITSPGGKMMIYVWAYEQTRRKFTSQDVLIPWIKPELAGSSRTKLSNMEANANCSFDNTDSQDEQLFPDADSGNAKGNYKLETQNMCSQPDAFMERLSDGSSHQTEQRSVKLPCMEVSGVFNCQCCLNGNNDVCLPSENDIDERDVEWTPEDADKPLLYPQQLVSECKKVGKLLRYLTTKNECLDSRDLVVGEDDRYADSCDEVQLNSETRAMFRFNVGRFLDHNAETRENGVCLLSMTGTSYLPRETSDEDSAASTMRLLEDCPSSSLLSSKSKDSIVWGANFCESIVHASSSINDTTAIEDSLENDSSSSNISYDSEGSQLSAEETLFSDSFSKSITFDPFSRSPPEVPSDTSISESNSVYTELNSRLAVLNSNRRDEPGIQSVHYFDDQVRQKAPYTYIKPALPLNLPAQDADTNISHEKFFDSHVVTENRTRTDPQYTSSVFEQMDMSEFGKEVTNQCTSADHNDKMKSQSSLTKRRELLYLNGIRQNMKNLYAKFTDAYQTNKKSGGGSNLNISSQGGPSTKNKEPMTKTKREDQATLQYYREVCFFPSNNQYESMKSCLGKCTVPSTPKLIQGRRHSLLDFARRLSGAKGKTVPQTNPEIEENRKLSLSDALTMIGDGYGEDYIEDKLDSAAKKMFAEMRKVNFGIRPFPRSSVGKNHSPAEQQMESRLSPNNSLPQDKENAKQITGRVVDSLPDGQKQIEQDYLRNGLIQLAGDNVQNGLVQLAENTLENGLVQLAENTLENGLVQLAENTLENGLVQLAENTLENGLTQLAENTLENGLTQLAENTHENGLVQLAENTVQNDLVQLVENTIQKGLVQLAENTAQIGLAKLHQHTPFSLSHTLESFGRNQISIPNTAKLKDDKQLLKDIHYKPTNVTLIGEISRDISNNATDNSVGTKLNRDSAPIVDTMIVVSPQTTAQFIGHVAVSEQSARSPPLTPELSDRKGIISSLSRYYHVFKEGELESLIIDYVPSLLIVDSYYDHANWCVVAEKL